MDELLFVPRITPPESDSLLIVVFATDTPLTNYGLFPKTRHLESTPLDVTRLPA